MILTLDTLALTVFELALSNVPVALMELVRSILDNCMVFAKGDDANSYKKDTSDDSLSQYFVVTEEYKKGAKQ